MKYELLTKDGVFQGPFDLSLLDYWIQVYYFISRPSLPLPLSFQFPPPPWQQPGYALDREREGGTWQTDVCTAWPCLVVLLCLRIQRYARVNQKIYIWKSLVMMR